MATSSLVAAPIGGSEAAAACGLDPFRSRVQLWLEKTGKVEPIEAGEAARWGTLLEPLIRAETMQREAVQIYAGDVVENGHLIGHTDGRVESSRGVGVFEAKATGIRQAPLWNEGEVPVHVTLQVHHYLTLTGFDHALVAALIGGSRLETRWIERDGEVIERMLALEDEFWRFVTSDTPPPPDGSAATDAVLKRLYPTSSGEIVNLTTEDAALVARLRQVKDANKEGERQESELEQRVKMRLGDAAVGIHDGVTLVKWTNVESKRFDVAAFKADQPTLAALYEKPTQYRRLWVSK